MHLPTHPAAAATVLPAHRLGAAEVEAAVTLSSRAPSIHNTQPWRWQLHDGVLDLRADRTRQLTVVDSDGHSLLISCGAALALVELGLRSQGYGVEVERFPVLSDDDLLARLHATGAVKDAPEDADLVAAAWTRRTERRPFGRQPVMFVQIEAMRRAAVWADGYAHFPVRTGEMLDLAVAVSDADRVEQQDAAYLAEMARWVHAGTAPDGVPGSAVPHVPHDSPRHTDLPLRDFEVGTPGGELVTPGIDEKPLLALIFTTADQPVDRLQAGEATMRVMLEAERRGISSCALSQALDMPALRSRLKMLMSWPDYPQMMLRLGSRPAGEAAPLTYRRPLDDILTGL
jgi:nitroreductase